MSLVLNNWAQVFVTYSKISLLRQLENKNTQPLRPAPNVLFCIKTVHEQDHFSAVPKVVIIVEFNLISKHVTI